MSLATWQGAQEHRVLLPIEVFSPVCWLVFSSFLTSSVSAAFFSQLN